MNALLKLPRNIKQYLLITANYWAFTLTDGALRMLVVLYFYQLGYSPLQIAMLFIFYEIFGMVTNLVGGWLGATMGLNNTMNIGLALQLIALSMLLASPQMLSVFWVMAAQAISGIAKDLNKMSAKSAIKLLVPTNAQSTLYQWVALLTGSKNTLKGIGFFLGGLLLSLYGFQMAILIMLMTLLAVWLSSLWLLKKDLGKSKAKPKFKHLFAKKPAINILAAARLFLFAARDIWFVVALPVYLSQSFGWSHSTVGAFLALWVIGYGGIQAITPQLTGKKQNQIPDGRSVFKWALPLAATTILIAAALHFNILPIYSLIIGLTLFGVFFAINSSLHSYLIVSYASQQSVSMDVGFYYMANAFGRLLGTLLSGWVFQHSGLEACLWVSATFITTAAIISTALPTNTSPN